MGVGPESIALYHQFKTLGVFDEVREVLELGSQVVWCPQKNMMRELFRAFGREPPSEKVIQSFADWKGSARELYEALGFAYTCVDVDKQFGGLVLDLNFDAVPPEHKNRYGFVTNHGTSEHIMNQYNVFKMMHDFTKPGGFMLHHVPFTVHLEHGFFNYQPNFFDALARYNSYKVFGVWLRPDWQLTSCVPWHPSLLDYMSFNSKSTHGLVILHQKMYEQEFCVPFQNQYEGSVPDESLARYNMVIDGELYDGARARHITRTSANAAPAVFQPVVSAAPAARLNDVRGRELARELGLRIRRRLRANTSALAKSAIHRLRGLF